MGICRGTPVQCACTPYLVIYMCVYTSQSCETSRSRSGHCHVVVYHYIESLQQLYYSRIRNAVVTCETKLVQNYLNLRRRPSEIILFQSNSARENLPEISSTTSKDCRSSWIFSNTFNVAEIIWK